MNENKNEVLEYLNTISILYVEDEKNTREELEYFLQKRVKNLYVAKNGEEGLALYKEHKPDAIISDIQMPIVDGIELSTKIREENSKIPIILLTAYNDVEYLFEAIKLNIDHYLTKPLNLKFLVEKIVDIAKKIHLERKNQEIQNILEQYKTVVDEGAIFFKINCNGLISYANENFTKISKYSKEELIGKPYNIIHNYKNEEDITSSMVSAIKSGQKIWKKKIKSICKDGEYYYLDMTVKPIFDLDGNINELIIHCSDITDIEMSRDYFKNLTQKNELDLNESIKISNSYKEAIDSSNIIIKIDADRNITYINNQFTKVLGFTKEDLVGQPYSILKQPYISDQAHQEQMENYFSGEIYRGTIANYAKDGSLHYFNITTYPLKNRAGDVLEFIGIRHDITKIEELHRELTDTQAELLYKLGEIGETRSCETGNHVKRVATYSKLLAEKLNLGCEEIKTLFIASPMHDIGKVGIPDSILNKPDKLTSQEWEVMKNHSKIGYDILKSSNREILKAAAQISYTHHEKWDGTGYPQGLKGEEIPIFGRITAIADVFDALGSDRVYKKAWEHGKILEFFKEQKGKHFDPELVDIFFDNMDEFLAIRDKYRD